MKTKDLLLLGVPLGPPMDEAFKLISAFCLAGGTKESLADEIAAVVANPASFQADPLRSDFAASLLAPAPDHPAKPPAPWRQWGTDIDETAIKQLELSSLLPISVAAALMPDAHLGYGLPIGGVLATENAVIPYAVGVDIACRMKMTVLDLPISWLDRHKDRLTTALENETRFGVGATFKHRREHPVLDEDWSVSPITTKNKDRARAQLGTSGSGNHFVEFGILTVTNTEGVLEPGEYLALLSHSGSRGTGAAVCDHYSKLAKSLQPELPPELSRLAWLPLDSEEGQEYWNAMNLMGRYAAANHALIHRQIATRLGAEVRLEVENHHNFAWKESHFGKEVIVHRKGATPAGTGVLGIIPGSMATPGFLVRGKGHPDSLHSASHGAGRAMSRTQAKKNAVLARCQRLPPRSERDPSLLRTGRSARLLQRHRNRHGRPKRPRRSPRPL